MSESERAEVEALLERNPQAREFVDGLRATAAQLEREFAAENAAGLTPQQRAAIVDPRPRVTSNNWMRYAAAAALAIALGGTVVLVTEPWRSRSSSFMGVRYEIASAARARGASVGTQPASDPQTVAQVSAGGAGPGATPYVAGIASPPLGGHVAIGVGARDGRGALRPQGAGATFVRVRR